MNLCAITPICAWIPSSYGPSAMKRRRSVHSPKRSFRPLGSVLTLVDSLDLEIHGGQARDDVAVSTFQVVYAGHNRGALSNGCRDHIGQPGAQVGNGDVLIGGRERCGPNN